MPGMTDLRIHSPAFNRLPKTALTLPQTAVTSLSWEPASMPSVRFGATRPLFGQGEKAQYQALKDQALQQRKALPALLQMSHLVTGEVGIEQMQGMMETIKATPATAAMLADGTKAGEKQFLDTLFQMEALTRKLDSRYVNTEANPYLHAELANLAALAFEIPDPHLQRLFFEGPRDLYYKRRNFENSALKPFLAIQSPEKRDDFVEALFTPNAAINDLCYQLLPFMTKSPRRDVLIQRIATEQEDWRTTYAVPLLPLVEDDKLRDQLIERLLNTPNLYRSEEAIQGLQWHSDPVKKDQLIEGLFKNPQYKEKKEECIDALAWMSNTQRRDQLIREMTRPAQNQEQKSPWFYEAITALQFLSDPLERDQRIEKYAQAAPVDDKKKKTDEGFPVRYLHRSAAKALKGMADPVRRDACIEKLIQLTDGDDHVVLSEVALLLPAMQDVTKRDVVLDRLIGLNIHKHHNDFDFTTLLLSLKNPTPKTIEIQNQLLADTFGSQYGPAMESIEKYFPMLQTAEQRDQVIEKICAHPKREIREYGAYALVHHSSPERQLELFKTMLGSTEYFVKDYAGSAAIRVKNPEVYKALMGLLAQDKEYSVQEKAHTMAVRIQDPVERNKNILAFLKSDNYQQRQRGIDAIESIQDLPLRDELLKKYADDPNHYVRQAVARQLKLVSNPALRDALAEKLSKDVDRDTRGAISSVLPQMVDKAKRNEIIERLNKDDDAMVHQANTVTTMNCLMTEPLKAFIEAHPTYMTHFRELKSQLDPEQLIPLEDALFTLSTLAGMENDASRMKEIFNTFYALKSAGVEQPSLIIKSNNEEAKTPANVRWYFTSNARPLLTALALLGPQKVKVMAAEGRLDQLLGAVNEDVLRPHTPEYKMQTDGMKAVQTLAAFPNATLEDSLKAMKYMHFYHFESRQQKMVDWDKVMDQVDLMKTQGALDFNLLHPDAIVTPELEIRPGWVKAMFQIMVTKDFESEAE